MSKSYSEKLSRRTVMMAVVPLAILFAGKAALTALGVDDGGWFVVGLILCGFSAFLILGAHYWKLLDDMQRQGQAVSGYWGGMAGLGVTACIMAAAGLSHSQFALGVATLAVFQLVCSTLIYAFWSLKGRGFSFRSGE
ncbi:MAG: hypothetical protein H6918_06025 [Sphingomonadaceae bacterium]|nr:hypothetical protein [Sphingomonadaceae bacterium]